MKTFALALVFLLSASLASADSVLLAHAEVGSSAYHTLLAGASVGLEHDRVGGTISLAAGSDLRAIEADLYLRQEPRAHSRAPRARLGLGLRLESGPSRTLVLPVYRDGRRHEQTGIVYVPTTDRAARPVVFLGLEPAGGGGPFAEVRALLGHDPALALRVGLRL